MSDDNSEHQKIHHLEVAEVDDVSLLKTAFQKFDGFGKNLNWDDFVCWFYENQLSRDYKILVAFEKDELVATEASILNFKELEFQKGVRELGYASLAEIWIENHKKPSTL